MRVDVGVDIMMRDGKGMGGEGGAFQNFGEKKKDFWGKKKRLFATGWGKEKRLLGKKKLVAAGIVRWGWLRGWG